MTPVASTQELAQSVAASAAEADEDERPGALIPITSVPKFISREEHVSMTSTTPASWTDIPPVLRFNEEGVKIEFDPAYRNQTELRGDIWVTEGYESGFIPYSSAYVDQRVLFSQFRGLLAICKWQYRLLVGLPQDHATCCIQKRRDWQLSLLPDRRSVRGTTCS